MNSETEKLKIISLGGAMEIGKNMTAYVYNEKILVLDAGLMFPEEEMLGVDIVIPDITYLEEHKDDVLGIVLSHGHEDHIGALPYVLRRLDVPVFGAPLTIGFVENKLKEHNLLEFAQLNSVEVGETIEIGEFTVEYVRVSHSIPDAAGLIIRTPHHTVVHSSDFKFDQSPVDGFPADIGRFARAGEAGVDLFICDSTNAEKPGFSPSEKLVGDAFDRIFAKAVGRIIVAAFASNIHRVQQVYDVAYKYHRRVAVIGRSMAENSRIAAELGYLDIPEDTSIRIEDVDNYPADEVVIVTTGSQGEPLSALSRMASDAHKQIKIGVGDTVIISATPIPGNEDLVWRTINSLFRQGAEVIYEPFEKVHVSGHGNQEDIRLMINLLQPKFVMPVHGEQRHYACFKKLAESMGFEPEHIIKITVGDVIELGDEGIEVLDEKVAHGRVMVDGLGVGDVEDVVLRDRAHLAGDGVVVCVLGLDLETGYINSGPDIITRGFASEDFAEEITEEVKELIVNKLVELVEQEAFEEIDTIKSAVRKVLAKFIYERTHRRPVIVPVIIEI